MEASKLLDNGWTIGVFGLIYDKEGRVLISERHDGKGWNLLGGRAESQDLKYELVREIKEETSLQVFGKPLFVNPYPLEELRDITILFVAKAIGKPESSD